MKATDLLQQQHRRVEVMFGQLEAGKGDTSALLEDLARDLACHMAIEQNIFYPAVRECDTDLVDESFEEHAIAEVALKRLLRAGPRDATFHAKLTTLKELVQHHVDEEEAELFPAVEKALEAGTLDELGDQLQKAFADAQREGFLALVPQGFARTSADESRKLVAQAASNGGARAHR